MAARGSAALYLAACMTLAVSGCLSEEARPTCDLQVGEFARMMEMAYNWSWIAMEQDLHASLHGDGPEGEIDMEVIVDADARRYIWRDRIEGLEMNAGGFESHSMNATQHWTWRDADPEFHAAQDAAELLRQASSHYLGENVSLEPEPRGTWVHDDGRDHFVYAPDGGVVRARSEGGQRVIDTSELSNEELSDYEARMDSYREILRCHVVDGRAVVDVTYRNSPWHPDGLDRFDRQNGRLVATRVELGDGSYEMDWSWEDQHVASASSLGVREPARLEFAADHENSTRWRLYWNFGRDVIQNFSVAIAPVGQEAANATELRLGEHVLPGGGYELTSWGSSPPYYLVGQSQDLPSPGQPALLSVWVEPGYDFTIHDVWAGHEADVRRW